MNDEEREALIAAGRRTGKTRLTYMALTGIDVDPPPETTMTDRDALMQLVARLGLGQVTRIEDLADHSYHADEFRIVLGCGISGRTGAYHYFNFMGDGRIASHYIEMDD